MSQFNVMSPNKAIAKSCQELTYSHLRINREMIFPVG